MPQFNEDITFSVVGKNLGSTGAEPNLKAQNITATGTAAVTGNTTLSGTLAVTGASTLTGNVTAAGTLAVGGGSALSTSNQTGTGSLVLATSPTITSPVINGTPTGTGLPTITLKKGSAGGTYSSASTTYVRVDTTNLAYTVTIPTGWKLMIHASGCINTATSAVICSVALADGSGDNSGILVENNSLLAGSTSAVLAFALNWVVSGDGASHTINLQYKTSNGADSVQINNSTSTNLPTMTFLLTPSN